MKLYQRLFLGIIVAVAASLSLPWSYGSPLWSEVDLDPAVASDDAVNLQQIKDALGLTDLGIEDDTLEGLLGAPITDDGITLRRIAEDATIRVSYLNHLQTNLQQALIDLADASTTLVYDDLGWSSILEVLKVFSPLLGLGKDIVLFPTEFLNLVSSTLDVVDAINFLKISNEYYAFTSCRNFNEIDEWNAFANLRDLNRFAWFIEHADEVRQAAMFNAYARCHSPEILDFGNAVAQLVRERVEVYRSYQLGQYTVAVTSSPTTVMLVNTGQYSIFKVILKNERAFLPDETSAPVAEIGPGEKVVLSFASGVDKIDLLEFIILGAEASVPFHEAPVLPLFELDTIAPSGDYAPREVQFDASSTIISQGVAIQRYEWDFGDGSLLGQGVQITYVYQQSGNYQVTLSVVTSSGSFTTQQTISVLNPVNASFSVTPRYGPISTEFKFDASASDTAVGNIVSLTWDFSDGSPQEQGILATHQYSQEGIKTVALAVANDEGVTHAATKTIVVGQEAPIESPDLTVVGASSIWQRGLGKPVILTAPFQMYDITAVGVNAVWPKGLVKPTLDTEPAYLYNVLTVGADTIWAKELAVPTLDTKPSHLYDMLTVGADVVWSKQLAPIVEGVCADQDGDGRVDIIDVVIALQVSTGTIQPTPSQLLRGDVNQDGSINIFDTIPTLQRIVGLVPTLEGCPTP